MTIQISEKLIFKGEQMQMPVSSSPSLPKDHPRIVNGDVSFRMSACWRGYVGTWAVKDEKLFLVDLHGDFALDDDTPILADWFTGTIVAPQGEMIHHPGHIGECLHETDLRITIENGKVVRSETVDNQDKLEEVLAMQRNSIALDIPPFLRRQAD